MIINFKYEKYYEIVDQYSYLFEYADPGETKKLNGNSFLIRGARYVFPQLRSCFREAVWYYKGKGTHGWELQDSGFLQYPKDERDINKYVQFRTGTIYYSLYEVCRTKRYPVKDINSLDCYFDTSEFIDDVLCKKLLSN